MAFLIILVNQKDDTQWFRVLELHRGISDISSERIYNIIRSKPKPFEAFCKMNLEMDLLGLNIQHNGIEAMKRLQPFLIKLQNKSKSSLFEIINCVIEYIQPLIIAKYPSNAQERLMELKQLQSFAQDYCDISSFVTDLLLQMDFASFTKGKISVKYKSPLVLSTIHQAKGLEWDIVFLIGLWDGNLPSNRSLMTQSGIEEERRVFYVGITRPRKILYLSYSKMVQKSDGTWIEAKISRFLEEIDNKKNF
jgi:DNA helicase-2/ATP-dependent DNA helicase PcrA